MHCPTRKVRPCIACFVCSNKDRKVNGTVLHCEKQLDNIPEETRYKPRHRTLLLSSVAIAASVPYLSFTILRESDFSSARRCSPLRLSLQIRHLRRYTEPIDLRCATSVAVVAEYHRWFGYYGHLELAICRILPCNCVCRFCNGDKDNYTNKADWEQCVQSKEDAVHGWSESATVDVEADVASARCAQPLARPFNGSPHTRTPGLSSAAS